MKRHTCILAFVITALAAVVVRAQDTLDYALLARIQDEGLSRSQVTDHVGWLADVYGPRLTGSPGFKQAADWAIKRLGEWGLANAKTEKWKFGKGWSLTHFEAHLVEPQRQALIGSPKAWTPGTKGSITADVVRVAINSEADFDKYYSPFQHGHFGPHTTRRPRANVHRHCKLRLQHGDAQYVAAAEGDFTAAGAAPNTTVKAPTPRHQGRHGGLGCHAKHG